MVHVVEGFVQIYGESPKFIRSLSAGEDVTFFILFCLPVMASWLSLKLRSRIESSESDSTSAKDEDWLEVDNVSAGFRSVA